MQRILLALIAFGLGGAAHALAQTPAPASPPEVPSSSSLDAMLFYQLLLGELNVRGGDPGAGYSLILDAARRQKDPALYRRAVEVALQGRSGESALAAARAWSQALPGDNEADRFVLQILLALNRAGETGPVLRELLQSTPAASRNDAINAIPQTFARASDKALALAAVRDGLTPFMNQPAHGASAWTTLGRMELLNDRPAAAVDAARRGHAIDPASPYPALLAVELLERGESEAEPLIRQQIDADGHQEHNYPDYDLSRLPLSRVQDAAGLPLTVTVELPGRDLVVAVWLAQVGRVPVLLLDTDLAENAVEDRPITLPAYACTRARVRAVALAHGVSPTQRIPELMGALLAHLATEGEPLEVLVNSGESWLKHPPAAHGIPRDRPHPVL